MKKMMTFTLTALTMNVFGNGLDIAHRYQDAIDAYKAEQNTDKAKVILEDVLGEISNDHPLFDDIYKSYLDYSGVKASDDFEKAIKFATGKKEETFCKGVGLVFSEAFHSDGTISKLVLGDSKRTLATDSYSIMYEGRWTYQLDTGYRDPIKSEIWINSADENHYDIQELRNNPKGKDKGKWLAKWNAGSFSNSFSTKGSVKEPIPMYMAVDYQAWGTPDLGYRIDFKIGATQKISSHESTLRHGKINLIAERAVKRKLKIYQTKDFDQKIKTYNDCFLVETNIKFAGIERKK